MSEPVQNANDSTVDELEIRAGVLTQCRRRGTQREPKPYAVLFVHGFTGTAEETWRNGDLLSFPHLISTDPKLVDFDVFLFNNKTNFLRPPSIENVSNQLESAITDWLSPRRIVLVAHSMGGIVCMQYIINNLLAGRSLPIIGLMMYGTPMSGVELLNYVKLGGAVFGLRLPIVGPVVRSIFGNKQLRDMSRGSEYLVKPFW